MALQFHPEYANLLAVGCYDGSVAVYDVRQKTNKPLYSASPKAKKHTDTVWQVCWQVSPCVRQGRLCKGSCIEHSMSVCVCLCEGCGHVLC
jgi:WD40 repeat protein